MRVSAQPERFQRAAIRRRGASSASVLRVIISIPERTSIQDRSANQESGALFLLFRWFRLLLGYLVRAL